MDMLNIYFGKNVRKELKLKIHIVIARTALQCDSETWILREEDTRRTEASEMRFLRPLLGVSLRDKVRSIYARTQLGTEPMEKAIQEYQKKWHSHVERMPRELLPCRHIFITLLKYETLDIQE
jgi:hypothetical protein